jgi:pimeloyl-ACP methyl ester carboxylesterase
MGVAGRADVAAVIHDTGPTPEMGSAAWGLAGNMLGSTGGAAGAPDPLARALLSLRIVPGTQPLRYVPALWWALARLRPRPLLWVHGGRDEVCPRAAAALWFRALRPPGDRWRALLVPEAEHVQTLQAAPEEVGTAVRALLSLTRTGAGAT